MTYPSNFVGPSNNNFGTGGYHGTGFTGTVDFEAEDAVLIVSAFVDAEYPGPRDIFLWDAAGANGSVIDMVTVDIPFTGPGRIDLGFEVPGAGEYSIGGSQVDLYRNDDGANYPYSVGGLITLIGSSAGTDFYYYLYDLEVQQAPCRSPRVPVQVELTDPGFSYSQSGNTFNFSPNTSGANSYFWDFGDGTTSNQTNPVHTFTQAGTHIVTLTLDGNCSKTDTVGGSLGIQTTLNNSLSLYPNPSEGLFNLSLESNVLSDITIQVYTSAGKSVHTEVWPSIDRNFTLDLSELANGMYLLELSSQDLQIVERITIQE